MNMRVLLFTTFVISIIGTYATSVEQIDLADKVKNIIDQLLVEIPDAIDVTDKDIDIYTGTFQNAQITVNELSLSGLKDVTTKLSYSEKTSRLNYTFNAKDIGLVADITFKLMGIVNLERNLAVEVHLKGLKNEGYALVSTDEEKEVTDFTVTVSLEESNFDIEGLLNNEDLSKRISEFLTEHVAEVAKVIDYSFTPYFTRIVKDVINAALNADDE